MKTNRLSLAAGLSLAAPAMAAPVAFTSSTLNYNAPTNIALGWHFAHANNCGWFAAPSGDLTNSTMAIVAANDLFVPAGIGPACSHGFGFFWHVTDTTTGAFDQIYDLNF